KNSSQTHSGRLETKIRFSGIENIREMNPLATDPATERSERVVEEAEENWKSIFSLRTGAIFLSPAKLN
ncbi:TPA: hypothetical protein ACHK6G_004872, partial [Escherichia coli]